MTKFEIILYWSWTLRSPRKRPANAESVTAERLKTARELGGAIAEPKGRLLFA